MPSVLIINDIIIVLVASGNVIEIIYLSPETLFQPLPGNHGLQCGLHSQ